MCSSMEFGLLPDFFLEKDENLSSSTTSSSSKGFLAGLMSLEEGFKNTTFSTSSPEDNKIISLNTPESEIKEEDLDWKMSSDWDADEFLRSVLEGSHDVSPPAPPMTGPTLASSPAPMGSTPMSAPTLGSSSLNTPSLEAPDDDMDDLRDLVGLPFDVVLDSGASDSGMSSDSSIDQQMSPLSGCSVASPGSFVDMGLPGGGFSSPDSGVDTVSEVSSVSDLGSSSPHSSSSSTTSSSPYSSSSSLSSGSAILAAPGSPEVILGADDFITHTDSGFSSPVPQIVPEIITTTSSVNSINNNNNNNNITTTTTHHHTPTLITRPATVSKITPVTTVGGSPVLKTVTVAASSGNTISTSSSNSVSAVGGQTIVVTQASKGGTPTAQLVRGGTLLKSNQASRSILLPVTVKDLNQVRTIKIISTGGSNGVGVGGRGGVRTVVSTVRQPNASSSSTTTASSTTHHQQAAAIRTALLTTVRGQESKSLLKGGSATTVVTSARAATSSRVPSAHTSPTRIKSEHEDDDDDDDDDEARTSFQQLTLSDEEKRLLKKEGINLPTHYPLTKHEERELKRIRRKIRNKISAQDSRKRKKEYIDGLEDRVKACTEENQQLQKRIRTLEAQNESLLVQMRKFQNSVIGGSNNGRSQAHASTALMMLILSAALFIVPSVRQDGSVSDNELSLPTSKMPSAGHSRSLLEAGNSALVPASLEALETVDDEMASDVDTPLVQALTDHDYTPATKRQRTHTASPGYHVPPLDDYPPPLGKTDSGGGFPPDDGPGSKIAARIIDAMVDRASNNYSDPGGKHGNSQAVVVNLGKGQKRLRDDLELE